MKSKYEVDQAYNKRSAMHEKMAIKLLEEYEEKLIAGDNPDPRDYLKRYTGPSKDLRFFLNLATLLTVEGRKRRQAAARMLTHEEIKCNKQMLLKKLLVEEQ